MSNSIYNSLQSLAKGGYPDSTFSGAEQRQADSGGSRAHEERVSLGPEAHLSRRSDVLDGQLTAVRGKYRSPRASLDLSMLSVSHRSTSLQAVTAAHLTRLSGRVPIGLTKVNATLDIMSGRAGSSSENCDGSHGLNAGLVGSLVTGELSADFSGNSVTVGATAGVGVAGSLGVRDADKDGKSEACARAEVGPFILGLCVENPF